MAGATAAALRTVALFRPLPEAELDLLAQQAVRKRYDRNEVIFLQGDRGDGLYLLLQGHVSITRQSPAGTELLLTLHEPGEYFGELALFDDAPRSANAVASEPCTLLFLARRPFQAFLRTHPTTVLTCLEVVVRQLRRCTEVADELALLDVRTRLARRLLRLAEQGLVPTGAAASRRGGASFRLTQQQLANMTGATRESVNKTLQSFVAEGLLRVERGHICICDRERLQACAEGLL